VPTDPIEQLLLKAYPNPERKGCPGSATLDALAAKTIPPEDPLWQHIWKCSPCFAEFREKRDARYAREAAARRRRIGYGSAAAAVVLISFGATMTRFFTPNKPVSNLPTPPTVQTPFLSPGVAAVLNLEGSSPVRGNPGRQSSMPELQRIPRAKVQLTIYLPRGSEDGEYELRFEDFQGRVVLSNEAAARIENGLTMLRIVVDMASFPVGEYRLNFRRAPAGSWHVANFNLE